MEQRTGGRRADWATVADYRAAQSLAYLQRNAASVRRAYWAGKAEQEARA